MAQQVFEVASGYVNYGMRLELILQSSSNGATANTSTLYYWLRWTKKYSADGSYSYSNGNHVYLTLNGQPIVSKDNWGSVNISGLSQGQYVEFASGQITISHNSDGSKTIPVYARFYQNQRSDCDYVINKNFTLDKINRYATVSLSVGTITKNSVKITAETSLACKTFNFQYSPDNGNTWYATDVPGYIEGAAYIYNNQNTTKLTHTYNNLCYATTYRFRCLVTTTAGLYTGAASVTPVNATTSKPSLATLSSSSVVAGNNMTFGISIPDSGTKYRMSVRIGSSDGTGLIEDGNTNQTGTSRTVASSNWNTVYNAYPNSTSGNLWIRIATYSIDSNKYMGENSYTVKFDFSSIDLSPTFQSGFASVNIGLPSGIASSFPSEHIIIGEKANITATWSSSKVTLKNGATISGYKITWNGVTGSLLSNSTTTYKSYSTVIGNNPLKITVVDSRGKSATTTVKTIKSIEYNSPDIQLAIGRNGYSKTLVISGKCHIYPLTINSSSYNSHTTTIQYKLSSASTWTNISVSPSSVDSNGYFSISKTMTNSIELSSVYQVKVTVTDTVGNTITRTYNIPSAVPLFALCDDGSVGINCYPEDNYFLSLQGNLLIKNSTESSNTYGSANPTLTFSNIGGSQTASLIFTDYDAIQSSSSLTLVGNQGGEYFIAPNIKATGKFYGTLSGTATTATKLGSSVIGSSTNPIYLNNGTATACDGRTVPGIKSASSVTTTGYGTNNNYVVDTSLLSYWNGAYSGTSSNLAYCKKGTFGSIITKSTSDYVASTNGTANGWLTAKNIYAGQIKSSSSTSQIYIDTYYALNVRNYAGDSYQEVIASKFTNSSKEEFKTNIEEFRAARNLILDSKIYEYNLKSDLAEGKDKRQVGMIIERETPEIVINYNGEGIEQYTMTSILWKGVQENIEDILLIHEKINKIESKIEDLEKLMR